MSFDKPSFIAFTGVDRVEVKRDLAALSAHYPIEWGILIDDEREGVALFPQTSVRARLVSGEPLRWAAHICAAQARRIAHSSAPVPLDLSGFQRAQINHSFSGSDASHVANSSLFGRRAGVRTVLQCADAFPTDLRVDWLFDVSFGKGSRPDTWPVLRWDGPFCGYSGGLGPENVRDTLERIAAPSGAPYWIDMESGIRTDGWLDPAKCEAVCRAVYG